MAARTNPTRRTKSDTGTKEPAHTTAAVGEVDASGAMAGVRAYLSKLGGLDGSEIDEVASRSVTRAIGAWQASKGPFPTFAVACAKNDAKNYLRERTRARAREQDQARDDDDKANLADRFPARQYFSPDELWSDLRALCLAAFEHRHGRPWEEQFAVIECPPGELAAREAFQKLRIAAREVVDVIEGYPATSVGPCWQYLDWLREQQRVLFFQMSNSQPEPWPPAGRSPADMRARVAWVWTHTCPLQSATATTTSFGMLTGTLQYAVSSNSPRFSHQYLAVISLLSGNRPKVRFGAQGLTVTAVLELEAENMKKALARHGQPRRDK